MIVVSSFVVALALSEGVLRVWGYGAKNAYYMFPPNSERTFKVDTEIIHGVTAPSRFVVNHLGLRGKPPAGEDLRVLVIGGSTVESLIIDEGKDWPALLNQMLNETFGDGRFWVGNAGRSGITVFENILQVRHLPETVGRVDIIIALLGGNDMAVTLRDDSEPPESVPAHVRMGRTFSFLPSNLAFPENLALVRLWRRGSIFFNLIRRGQLLYGGTSDAYTGWVSDTRSERWNSRPFIDKIPDISLRLDVYRRNFETLIDEARKRDVMLVAVTQPQLHRPGLSEEAERTLGGWWGATSMKGSAKDRKYYSAGAVSRAGRKFDAVLIDGCKRLKVTCLDAAGIMKPSLAYYYDGVHYTNAGSKRLAEIILRELRPLFQRALRDKLQ